MISSTTISNSAVNAGLAPYPGHPGEGIPLSEIGTTSPACPAMVPEGLPSAKWASGAMKQARQLEKELARPQHGTHGHHGRHNIAAPIGGLPSPGGDVVDLGSAPMAPKYGVGIAVPVRTSATDDHNTADLGPAFAPGCGVVDLGPAQIAPEYVDAPPSAVPVYDAPRPVRNHAREGLDEVVNQGRGGLMGRRGG